MLTNWIPRAALKSLNEGFVVAIMLEPREGEADPLAEILRIMTPPTMAEPGAKLFLPYRSPTNPSCFLSSNSMSTKPRGGHMRRLSASRPPSPNYCRGLRCANAYPSFHFSPIRRPTARWR
jgi:hypothetical protein